MDASATTSTSKTNRCESPNTAASTPATTSTRTTNSSQHSASSADRSCVRLPPSQRSTGVVASAATTVGAARNTIPCQASWPMSNTGYVDPMVLVESKTAIPVNPPRSTANARVRGHRGARKMNLESPASRPCVAVTGSQSTPADKRLSGFSHPCQADAQIARKFSNTASPSSVCATSGCHCTP